MRVVALTRRHLQPFPEHPWVDGMEGLTLLDGEKVVAAMGTAPMPWGTELWIARRLPLSGREKRAIARLARWYMGILLGEHETLYVHARPGEQERWFRWLGLELAGDLPDGLVRWVAGGVTSWASS